MRKLLVLLAIILSSFTVKDTDTIPRSGIILLSFDGYKTDSHTQWTKYTGTDSNTFSPSDLSNTDRKLIIGDIKNYFHYWRVIVTTNEDSFYMYNRNHRARLVLTSDTLPDKDPNSAGLSFLGVVPDGDTTMGLVWTKAWKDSILDPRLIANAVHNISLAGAHEIGHMMGLGHQAYMDSFYNYYPVRIGDQNYGPIMGWSFLSDTAVWYVGTNAQMQIQDDVAIISRTWKRRSNSLK